MRQVVTLLGVLAGAWVLLLVVIAMAGIFAAILLPAMSNASPVLILPFALGLVGILLVVAFVISFFRRKQATSAGQGRGQADTDEAQMMQEIHRSLGRMEERIDALETLLLERGDLRGANRMRTVEGSGREPR